ncbi:MAG TPA: bifunctional diaminohydroxyphosphoribosylaminopyrimidine deaminase/5-amino-6-(5-phosphoribosylamino)uracil reductase RibD [Rhizomicrobium sp.]|jgi:diaminohydroxyphosphoribosylaminopyrimidine deaminase/5-amino-6-(5-phosphoribosylamino)uracil reductase|nr:bifunctional diaminohydroxyphosphoribosylaminopyrimidine deaminase/5-amino-6-(5-phosphoribosylamino)uracil reductase RibD [Rhizomicrobium sp.]
MRDIAHMRHALALAERALGIAAPNPAVGCVIVSPDGRVVGRGWTQKGGRPHAETIALAQAGEAARGGTAYVTLEPCAHHGQTPPCARALIESGVARVVASLEDPDPRVSGKGFAMLWDAGVEVTAGALEDEAAAINAGFFLAVREKRPLVTLKIAMSLDGKTATVSGQSKWITGAEARRFGHLLRAKHDAILIGIGTAFADDPELTCRLPGLEDRSPLRVVLDTRLRLPERSKLAQTARKIPTLLFTTAEGGQALVERGVEVRKIAPDARGRPDVAAALAGLAERGVTRLLVEGGSGVHASFLDRGLCDRLELFRAPIALGGAGRNAIDALKTLDLDEAARFVSLGRRRLGPDVLESFEARA